MANTTKLHTVDSLIDESGNRQIFYNQNTIKDVKVDDDQDETIEGHLNYYAECSTAADDASKAIGVIGGEHDVVKAGATFDITFTNGNTAADPTLVVNNGTAYPLDGITETTIKAGQTFSFIFNGEKFISKGSSSSGTEIKKDTVTGDTEEGSDKYVALVDGAESNATIKFDENIVVNKEGLKAPIANSTVKFEDATAEANTDYRTSSPLTSEESVATGFQKLKKILAGLGALAFKPSVGTTELDTTLSAAYNNRVSKSDLYNGTDYATAGEKALDAKAGATLQNSITSLNSKMTSFENTKSEIVGSALGKAIGLSTSSTWNDVVTKIKSVADRGTDQTTNSIGWGSGYFALNSIPEGYYRSSGYSWAPEIRTNRSNFGTASAGNVLSGVTFTSQNGIRISGTMKNYTNSIQTATTDATDSSKSCYWARNGYIDVIPAVGYWGSWNWDRSYIRVPDRYNDGYNAGVNAKTSKSWTGHINTTSGGSFTTGFQPNVILLKRDGDNFPIGVYCSYGISVNHIEGPSNSHLSNIFSTNSNGFSLGTLNAYTKDKYCYCAAFKIV